MRVDKKIKEELKVYLIEKLKSKQVPVIHIAAPYQLDQQDIELLKKKFNFLKVSDVVVDVDKKILAGCIISFDSRIIDLTVDQELKILANTLYETA